MACTIVSAVRRHKTDAAVAMRTPVARLHITTPAESRHTVGSVVDDPRTATRAAAIIINDGPTLQVDVTLDAAPAD